MTRTRRTAGIVLACLLLPPLLIGGLLKAGHYTFVTRTLTPERSQWYLGPTDVMLNYEPVRGYRLTLNSYDIAVYRPQDIPPQVKWYLINARVLDEHKCGIPNVILKVSDLAGNTVEDPDLVVRSSGYGGLTYQHVGLMGDYDVIAGRHGYLPIKKRVQVGPNGTSVKFVLPRALHGGVPSRKLPEAAPS